MTEIRFYHVQNRPPEQAVYPLLVKALEAGHKIVIRAADQKAVKALNDQLWSMNPAGFLPHGSADEGHSDKQPIYLTHENNGDNDNPNGANMLVMMPGAPEGGDVGEFDLCCEMLNGRDDMQVAGARARWKIYKDAGHEVTYWQQSETGAWDKKA